MIFVKDMLSRELGLFDYKMHTEVSANNSAYEYVEKPNSYNAVVRNDASKLDIAIWELLPEISVHEIRSAVQRYVKAMMGSDNQNIRLKGEELNKQGNQFKFFQIYMRHQFLRDYEERFNFSKENKDSEDALKLTYAPEELFDLTAVNENSETDEAKYQLKLEDVVRIMTRTNNLIAECFGEGYYVTYMRTVHMQANIRIVMRRFAPDLMDGKDLGIGYAAEADFRAEYKHQPLNYKLGEDQTNSYAMIKFMTRAYEHFLRKWAPIARTSYKHKSSVISTGDGEEVSMDALGSVDLDSLPDETINFKETIFAIRNLNSKIFGKAKSNTLEGDIITHMKEVIMRRISLNLDVAFHKANNNTSRANEQLIGHGERFQRYGAINKTFEISELHYDEADTKRRVNQRLQIFYNIYGNYSNLNEDTLYGEFQKFNKVITGSKIVREDEAKVESIRENYSDNFFAIYKPNASMHERVTIFKDFIKGCQAIFQLEEQLSKWEMTLMNFPTDIFEAESNLLAESTSLLDYLKYFRKKKFRPEVYTEMEDGFVSVQPIEFGLNDNQVYEKIFNVVVEKNQVSVDPQELRKIKQYRMIPFKDIKNLRRKENHLVEEEEYLDITSIEDKIKYIGNKIRGDEGSLRILFNTLQHLLGNEIISNSTFNWDRDLKGTIGGVEKETLFGVLKTQIELDSNKLKVLVGASATLIHKDWGKQKEENKSRISQLVGIQFSAHNAIVESLVNSSEIKKGKYDIEALRKIGARHLKESAKSLGKVLTQGEGLNLNIELYKKLGFTDADLTEIPTEGRSSLNVEVMLNQLLRKIVETGAEFSKENKELFSDVNPYWKPESELFHAENFIRWIYVYTQVFKTLMSVRAILKRYTKAGRDEVSGKILPVFNTSFRFKGEFLQDISKLNYVFKLADKIKSLDKIKGSETELIDTTRHEIEVFLNDIDVSVAFRHKSVSMSDGLYNMTLVKIRYLMVRELFDDAFIDELRKVRDYGEKVKNDFNVDFNLNQQFTLTVSPSDFMERNKLLMKKIAEELEKKAVESGRLTEFTIDKDVNEFMHNKEKSKLGYLKHKRGDYVCSSESPYIKFVHNSGYIVTLPTDIDYQTYLSEDAELRSKIKDVHYTALSNKDDYHWLR